MLGVGYAVTYQRNGVSYSLMGETDAKQISVLADHLDWKMQF